jgi:hypothetical protein
MIQPQIPSIAARIWTRVEKKHSQFYYSHFSSQPQSEFEQLYVEFEAEFLAAVSYSNYT